MTKNSWSKFMSIFLLDNGFNTFFENNFNPYPSGKNLLPNFKHYPSGKV